MHATESPVVRPATRRPRPLVIGHRGAPAYRPEHTLAGFELAIEMGADVLEPDVVLSRDGALVVRHESELSRTTDIAARPEFADRRTARLVDGVPCTGWFTEDLTLAELRTLRAIEGLPELRPLNTAYDGQFGLLTLEEVVDLARRRSTAGRRIEVLVELKPPDGSTSAGPAMAVTVADELFRLDAATADGPVIVQSFDAATLRRLRGLLGEDGPRMVQLVDDCAAVDPMVTPAGLRAISTYAQGIGPGRDRILLRDPTAALTGVSPLVAAAHGAGLAVYVWTLRAENAFLPRQLRSGLDPAAPGDAEGEARLLLALGVDGLITDSPDVAVRARAALAALRPEWTGAAELHGPLVTAAGCG